MDCFRLDIQNRHIRAKGTRAMASFPDGSVPRASLDTPINKANDSSTKQKTPFLESFLVGARGHVPRRDICALASDLGAFAATR